MKFAGYIRQFEICGYEMILETAARDRDMSRRDLANLRAHMEYVDRTHAWKVTGPMWHQKGRWVPRDDERLQAQIRQCDQCGRDLPRSRNAKARFCDGACKQKWYRARRRERLAKERTERIAAARVKRRARERDQRS